METTPHETQSLLSEDDIDNAEISPLSDAHMTSGGDEVAGTSITARVGDDAIGPRKDRSDTGQVAEDLLDLELASSSSPEKKYSAIL